MVSTAEHPASEDGDRSRARAFLLLMKGFLPKQPGQLLFVGATLLLLCAPFLSWSPVHDYLSFSVPDQDVHAEFFRRLNPEDWEGAIKAWSLFESFAFLPFMFAALGSLVLCFSRVTDPARFLRRWIVGPVLLGLLVFVTYILLWLLPQRSVSESSLQRGRRVFVQLGAALWEMGPGLHAAILGLGCLAIGVWLVGRGRVSLPVGFREAAIGVEKADSEPIGNDRVLLFLILVFILIGLGTVLNSFLWLVAPAEPVNWPPDRSVWQIWANLFCGNAIPAVCAAIVIGTAWRRWLKALFKLPPWRDVALAVLVPLPAVVIPQLLLLMEMHYEWYFFRPHALAPPSISEFTLIPSAWLFLYFPLALFEEIGWRGYLLPATLRRFGLLRALLLVGLLWGLCHIHGDVAASPTVTHALLAVFYRSVYSILYTAPLAWLFLRTGSIWPAAVAHGALNVRLASFQSPLEGSLERWLTMCVWLGVGIVLFKYWRPQTPYPHVLWGTDSKS